MSLRPPVLRRAPCAARQPALRLRIAGVDEAGRGPLAGPVVAAAVILRPGRPIEGLADSKVLTPKTRERLSVTIRRRALCFGIGWADPAEIDSLNILHATFLAMRRAVLAMACPPDVLWVDGNRLPKLSGLGAAVTARAIIGGDAIKAAISAASILAKTARDHYMNQMHDIYPEYDFQRHKGYATDLHRRLLLRHGPCPLHRRSFAPVMADIDGLADFPDLADLADGADLEESADLKESADSNESADFGAVAFDDSDFDGSVGLDASAGLGQTVARAEPVER